MCKGCVHKDSKSVAVRNERGRVGFSRKSVEAERGVLLALIYSVEVIVFGREASLLLGK